MKGLILAGIALGFLVVCCAIALRFYRGDREYKVFLGAVAAAALVYVSLFRLLPADLGFLPREALEPAAAVDSWNGMLLLLMVFHGIWTFTYVVTGPTMRLLREASRREQRGLAIHEALALFRGPGTGNVLLSRRLQKLLSGGYVVERSGGYALTSRGSLAGRMLVCLKRAIGDIADD